MREELRRRHGRTKTAEAVASTVVRTERGIGFAPRDYLRAYASRVEQIGGTVQGIRASVQQDLRTPIA